MSTPEVRDTPMSDVGQLEAVLGSVRSHEGEIKSLVSSLVATGNLALHAIGTSVAGSGWELERAWPLTNEAVALRALQATFLAEHREADGEPPTITEQAPVPFYTSKVRFWSMGDAYERADGNPRSREQALEGERDTSIIRFINELAAWTDAVAAHEDILTAAELDHRASLDRTVVRLFKNTELAQSYFAWRTGQGILHLREIVPGL